MKYTKRSDDLNTIIKYGNRKYYYNRKYLNILDACKIVLDSDVRIFSHLSKEDITIETLTYSVSLVPKDESFLYMEKIISKFKGAL